MNTGDAIKDMVGKRLNSVRTYTKNKYKSTQPYNTTKVSTEEMLYYYDQEFGSDNTQANMDRMQALIQRKGEQWTNGFIGRMEKAKEKRGLS